MTAENIKGPACKEEVMPKINVNFNCRNVNTCSCLDDENCHNTVNVNTTRPSLSFSNNTEMDGTLECNDNHSIENLAASCYACTISLCLFI